MTLRGSLGRRASGINGSNVAKPETPICVTHTSRCSRCFWRCSSSFRRLHNAVPSWTTRCSRFRLASSSTSGSYVVSGTSCAIYVSYPRQPDGWRWRWRRQQGRRETKDRTAVHDHDEYSDDMPTRRDDAYSSDMPAAPRISNAKIGPGATWYKSHAVARGSVIIRYRFNRISLFPREIRRRCT